VEVSGAFRGGSVERHGFGAADVASSTISYAPLTQLS
jgi:hypothetical protein